MSSRIPGRSKRRAMAQAGFVLRGMLLALLAAGAQAQDDEDPDYSRLIFEVAEIPPIVDADIGARDATGAVGDGTAPVVPQPEDAPDGTAPVTTPAPVATTDAVASDVEDSAKLAADITAYRNRISDTLANSNPYSAALREQYDSLGSLLQRAGEYEDAIAAFESAMHIDRVNGGLYTLDQIPLVEKMIASHEALGHADEVNDLHSYLFYIQQKTYDDGDPRLLAAMEEWADWNMTSYMLEGPRYDSIPSISTGASLSSSRMEYVAVQNRDGSFSYIPRSQMIGAMNPLRSSLFDPAYMASYGVDAEQVIDARLRTARNYYEQIAEAQEPEEEEEGAAGAVEAANTETSLADEIRVQHKLANVAFAVKQQIDGMDSVMSEGSLYYNSAMQPGSAPQAVMRGYVANRDALIALAEQLEQDPAATAAEKAQAWISVGDWQVGFDNASRSDNAYRRAWEILDADGMSAAAIADVFMPQPLVAAPAFALHPYSREMYGIADDADLAWKGHMDLTLDVNRYGDVSGAEIESASADTPQVLRTELLRYLRNVKVRPAIVDGEMVKREDVKLRYYYTY